MKKRSSICQFTLMVMMMVAAAARAWGDLPPYFGVQAQTLYARVSVAGDTAFNLTEGTGLKVGQYSATNAVIAATALPAGQYTFRVFIGTAGAQAAGDVDVGVGYFIWSGSVTLDGLNVVQIEQVDATTQIANNTAGGATIPVNQVPVPKSRTWVLKQTDDGLVGELPRAVKLGGGSKLYSIEWAIDLATNGRLIDFNSAAIQSGTAGGLTFGPDVEDVDDFGVDRSQAKLRITPVTVGTYTIRVSVDRDDSDGGGTAEADVVLIVSQ